MKKLLLIPILSLMLVGCGNEYKPEGKRETFGAENFEVICRHSDQQADFFFLRDLDTDIIYIRYASGHAAGISTYYNNKGQPMNYQEFKSVHIDKYHI